MPKIIRPVLQPDVAEFARQNFAIQGGSDDANVERSLGATDAELRNFDRKGGCVRLQDRSITLQEIKNTENALASSAPLPC
ncbi:MAG: hypothetical protein FWB96_03980 [Defluviitaleaceae bacterium]|nr:hypothetical protein [Defluviitaleaceae bacterium]MCL2262073.1 hypothetical protein [Defluviitaleaceae bacterium]